jgi:hypothetical protein
MARGGCTVSMIWSSGTWMLMIKKSFFSPWPTNFQPLSTRNLFLTDETKRLLRGSPEFQVSPLKRCDVMPRRVGVKIPVRKSRITRQIIDDLVRHHCRMRENVLKGGGLKGSG